MMRAVHALHQPPRLLFALTRCHEKAPQHAVHVGGALSLAFRAAHAIAAAARLSVTARARSAAAAALQGVRIQRAGADSRRYVVRAVY